MMITPSFSIVVIFPQLYILSFSFQAY